MIVTLLFGDDKDPPGVGATEANPCRNSSHSITSVFNPTSISKVMIGFFLSYRMVPYGWMNVVFIYHVLLWLFKDLLLSSKKTYYLHGVSSDTWCIRDTFLVAWRLRRIEFRRLRAGGQCSEVQNELINETWNILSDLSIWMILKEKEAYVFVFICTGLWIMDSPAGIF